MVEQIVYNITMVALLICWVIANYFAVIYDDEDENILMARQALFQTMCLIALIGHNLFFK